MQARQAVDGKYVGDQRPIPPEETTLFLLWEDPCRRNLLVLMTVLRTGLLSCWWNCLQRLMCSSLGWPFMLPNVHLLVNLRAVITTCSCRIDFAACIRHHICVFLTWESRRPHLTSLPCFYQVHTVVLATLAFYNVPIVSVGERVELENSNQVCCSAKRATSGNYQNLFVWFSKCENTMWSSHPCQFDPRVSLIVVDDPGHMYITQYLTLKVEYFWFSWRIWEILVFQGMN